jgi:hypothetical protein
MAEAGAPTGDQSEDDQLQESDEFEVEEEEQRAWFSDDEEKPQPESKLRLSVRKLHEFRKTTARLLQNDPALVELKSANFFQCLLFAWMVDRGM